MSNFLKNKSSNQFNRLPDNKSVEHDLHVDSYQATLRMRNLNSLLSSLTPNVAVKFLSEPASEGSSSSESVEKPYFVLEDLWESFKDWSAYGVQVPLTLLGDEPVNQYFVPYLSAIQLYVDDHEGMERLGDKNEGTPSKLVYQYFERDVPYERPPLNAKVSDLSETYPHLQSHRSYDLSPCSWFSVAWYPIYRIPLGPSTHNLETAFLTFHHLSTQSQNHRKSKVHKRILKVPCDDEVFKATIPIFGLTTYKLRGSILTLPTIAESPKMNSLLKASNDWLQRLNVNHHDHYHFVYRS